MRYLPALSVCCLLLVLSAVSCGCTSLMSGTVPSPAPDPVTGSWLYPPPDDDQVLELYIFKESGRFDMTRFPADPNATLPYELYATGSWNRTGEREYRLVGNAIYHYFSPESHANQKVNTSLTLGAAGDALWVTGEPDNWMIRFSHDPVIPPGMDISFPFD